MPTHERPQVHPYLSAAPDERNPRCYLLWDRLNVSAAPLRLTQVEHLCVQMFDGQHTVREVQAEARAELGGALLPLEIVTHLVDKLEKARFLDGPRFRELLTSPVREPQHIGCYEAEPAALRRQVERLFTGKGGPGLPHARQPDGRLRAALIPHIDFLRGGTTFAWGFKELFERTEASLFVIIGTSHYSDHRFTLTRKHFKTPLGITPTNQQYIDRLVESYGDGLFDDETTHLPEHSIELEVVFLQYLYEGRRDIRIVPLLVGSFHDAVVANRAPSCRADIGRMIDALRKVEAETEESICYIISGDLAHIGPKFGDRQPAAEPFLQSSRRQDLALLSQAESADPAGYFRVIAEEGDARRICGFPPTYTVLSALAPREGKTLHYDQYVHPRGQESVSFASVGFYR